LGAGLVLLLDVLAAFIGILEIKSLYKAEDLFEKIKIHPILKPA